MLILPEHNFEQDPLLVAHSYLAPPVHSFWKWEDAGQVVVWAQGTTITFREELVEVLTRLAPVGLPPLSAVLLLLAACRDSWHQSGAGIGTLVGLLTTLQRRSFPPWLPDVLSRLDAVGVLRPELRRSPKAKAVLAEIVFEGWRNRMSPADAETIVQVLAAGPTGDLLSPQTAQRNDLQDLLDTLQGLDRGLHDVTAERLKLRLRTGLDELVEPAAVDLNAVERTRRLIASLLDDEQLGGVARIARHLMAAVHLPRSISDHDDLPVGGVTDISNRGPLDRLLLSELAHDDLTLAVRVALKEALYLRREAPPHNPPQHRAVLLDAGLRMWGVPRVFATGVALALTATATRHVFVDVYRAQRDDVVRVDLTTREGLVRHLEALEPEAQPGDALAKFLAAASDVDAPREAVLVTGEDVGADPAFRRSMAQLQVPTVYLATVSRDGSFRLTVRGPRGSKLVCQARLELEEMFAPRAPRRAPPLVDKRRVMDLPAIFSVRPFPLLLPHAVDPARMWPIGPAGLLAVTPDRRLMHWCGQDRAARQLTDQLPIEGPVVWHGLTRDTASTAVVKPSDEPEYFAVNVDWQSGGVQAARLDVDARTVAGFAASGGALLAFSGRPEENTLHVAAVDARTGRCLAAEKFNGPFLERQGRVFRLAGGVFVVSWDGQSFCRECVLDESDAKRLELEEFFESVVMEDVLGISLGGHVYSCKNQTARRIALPPIPGYFRVVSVADEGDSFVLMGRPEGGFWHVDLPDLDVSELPGSCLSQTRADLLRPAIERFVRTQSLPAYFDGISGVRTEGLTLLAPADGAGESTRSLPGPLRLNRLLAPDFFLDRFWLPLVAPVGGTRLLRVLRFTDCPSPAGPQLRTAQWSDGSRAWLDSRGLLHLRSSDASIPEVTFVLNVSHMAGWCSDGRYFGDTYYIGDHPRASTARVYREVLEPFLARLR